MWSALRFVGQVVGSGKKAFAAGDLVAGRTDRRKRSRSTPLALFRKCRSAPLVFDIHCDDLVYEPIDCRESHDRIGKNPVRLSRRLVGSREARNPVIVAGNCGQWWSPCASGDYFDKYTRREWLPATRPGNPGASRIVSFVMPSPVVLRSSESRHSRRDAFPVSKSRRPAPIAQGSRARRNACFPPSFARNERSSRGTPVGR